MVFAFDFMGEGAASQVASSNTSAQPVDQSTQPFRVGDTGAPKGIGLAKGVIKRNPATLSKQTPVLPNKLKLFLTGYNKAKAAYLVNSFISGFTLGTIETPKMSNSKNLASALQHPVIVDNKLEKEISLNRIAGPFPSPPFLNLVISPLGVVPKKAEGEFRLIHHLSYPEGGSVNDCIPREFSSVTYATIDQAITLVKSLGTGCFLAKSDIKSAFRIIPVRPEEYHLLGIKWKGMFYYDKCLPMGCSSSYRIFEEFSSALHWIMEHKLHASGVVHILDDFLFAGKSFKHCNIHLDKFLSLCKDIGVPIAQEKTYRPATTMSFVGLEIDTVEMTVRLPIDKLQKARAIIKSLSSRKKVTLKEIQEAVGFLNFACMVVYPGRTFLRRLIDLTCKVSKPGHHLRINGEHRADLKMWSVFLDSFNGKSLFLEDKWMSSIALQMHTDASGSLGYGAIMDLMWFNGTWPENWKAYHITVLELYPIVAAVVVWAKLLSNRCVVFFTDNSAVVEIINKQTSKDKTVMCLLRKLVITCLTHNILFKAKHIPGKHNISADLLSRLQVEAFHRINPLSQATPVHLPEDILPQNWKIQSKN